MLMAGAGVSLACSSLLRRVGHGTPVPIDPPQQLVVSGLYRHTRNPIYVADALLLTGIYLLQGSLTLLLYTLCFVVGIHLFLVRWEEPALRRRFGDDYVAYTRHVPRWIGAKLRQRPRASAN